MCGRVCPLSPRGERAAARWWASLGSLARTGLQLRSDGSGRGKPAPAAAGCAGPSGRARSSQPPAAALSAARPVPCPNCAPAA